MEDLASAPYCSTGCHLSMISLMADFFLEKNVYRLIRVASDIKVRVCIVLHHSKYHWKK
jgi:hypothetical protein